MSLMTLGVLRAVEYGLLGWALAWLAGKQESRVWHFVLVGAIAGFVFGGSITWLTLAIAAAKGIALAPPQIIATALNDDGLPDRLRAGRLHRAAGRTAARSWSP